MDEITSTRNPRVRELAALSRARERRARGRHLVEGPNAVGAAIAAGLVDEVLATDDGLAALTVPADVRVTRVVDHVLQRLVDVRTHQGVVAVARTPVAPLTDLVGRGLLVVLDAVADPGNAGTILRTADAAGATGLVLTPGSVDVFGPRAVRAAAGSTYHLGIAVDVEWDVLAAACRAAGQPLYGLDGRATRPVDELSTVTPPLALVLGNEAHGLGRQADAHLDGRVAIPLYGRAESLNVAAAAAVALYAAARALHPGV